MEDTGRKDAAPIHHHAWKVEAHENRQPWLPLKLNRKVTMSVQKQAPQVDAGMTLDEVREEILRDYRIVFESREASLLGRKEVLTGKAKFGIFGDGKELASRLSNTMR